VDAEVALALVEHDAVFLEVHRATGEQAERGRMVRGDRSWRSCTLSRKARPALPLARRSKLSRSSRGLIV